jgi:hypothetical protein
LHGKQRKDTRSKRMYQSISCWFYLNSISCSLELVLAVHSAVHFLLCTFFYPLDQTKHCSSCRLKSDKWAMKCKICNIYIVNQIIFNGSFPFCVKYFKFSQQAERERENQHANRFWIFDLSDTDSWVVNLLGISTVKTKRYVQTHTIFPWNQEPEVGQGEHRKCLCLFQVPSLIALHQLKAMSNSNVNHTSICNGTMYIHFVAEK